MKNIFILILLLSQSLLSQNSQWMSVSTNLTGLDSAHGTRIVIADVNNDNYPDLLWGTGNINKNRYYLYMNVQNSDNQSKYKRIFKDFTDISGINKNRDQAKTGRIIDVASFADVDNDGDLDLVSSIYYHRLQMYKGTNDPGDRSEVYLNDGSGKFTLYENNGLNKLTLVDTLTEGLINATGMSFLDYDYDGNIDLYISTWFSDYAANLANNGMGYKMKDALLKGDGKGAFTLVTGNGYDNISEPMYGVNVTDWDNDGWQDILTSPYCRSNGSLFRNMHDGTFYDMASAAGYSAQKMGGDHGQALCQWEAQPADFDNDGDMDLLQVEVHGGNDPGEGKTHISINNGPDNGYSYEWDLAKLRRDAPESTTHFGDQGGTWFDIDYDTRQDVAVACMGYQDAPSKTNLQGQTRLYILRQNDSLFFDDITKSLGLYENMKEGHSMEPCDYDLDGDLDLFFSHLVKDSTMSDTGLVVSEHMQIELIQNDVGNSNNWIGVKLLPPAGCNKAAIGARIYIYSDSLVQMQEVQAGLGHFAGQQSFTRYVGLKAYQIDSIQVRWPHKDLITTTIYNPEINTIQQINGNGTSSYLKTWTNAAPVIAFKNPYLYFGQVNVGSQPEKSFIIRNTGETELKIENLKVLGEGFAISESKLNIPAGESREIKVKFLPAIRKTYTAQILIESNAINAATSYIYLNGDGFEPKPMIAISTDSLIFESAFIDETRETELIIYNTGELELIFNSISLIGIPESAFIITSQPSSIPAGSDAKIKLSFQPTEIKEYIAVLSIKSNSYNEPEINIPVKGLCNGPLPGISCDKPTIFLGSVEIGQEKSSTLDIKNTGNADLVISNIFVENDVDAVYSISGFNENMTLKPEDSVTVGITFKPVQAEKYNLDLVIETNIPDISEYRVPIKATGKTPSDVDESEHISNLYTLSPIPAGNELQLSYSGDDSGTIIYLTIYDMTGQLIVTQTVTQSAYHTIDISGLLNGCYYLRVLSGDRSKIVPFIILK